MNSDGVYLLDEDAFLDFIEAMSEHYNNDDDVDVGGDD